MARPVAQRRLSALALLTLALLLCRHVTCFLSGGADASGSSALATPSVPLPPRAPAATLGLLAASGASTSASAAGLAAVDINAPIGDNPEVAYLLFGVVATISFVFGATAWGKISKDQFDV
eukprot:gb/GFBE01078508.1/.p1 GENE.gb/GFBE01078508.1/~~gb/GFBE01078508.1/.p1  ORF type:complete len:121 (+),score=17.94 gb/GFBE01078508.1/:1-363(+)